jgi:adenosylcobinamide-GDP ribazoletransferase
MRNLVAAIRFITILPAGRSGLYEPRGMIPYFPLAGVVVGLMLALADQAFLALWPRPAAAVLDVVFLATVTGALHLDGLGDSADGLLGHRPPDKALAIMKDSRLGAMALVAIVSVLAIKWAGLASLESRRFLLLLLIPAYARGAMLFAIRFLPYGRPQGGTGYDLFHKPLKPMDFSALVGVLLVSLFLGWQALWLNAVFVLTTAAIIAYYRTRVGCITGDMLGAMTEILEAILFLAAAVSLT